MLEGCSNRNRDNAPYRVSNGGKQEESDRNKI